MAILDEDKEEKRRRASKLQELKYKIKSNRMDEWNRAIDQVSSDLLDQATSPRHISDLESVFARHSLPTGFYRDLQIRPAQATAKENRDRTQETRTAEDAKRVFVSYAKEDAKSVRKLYNQLSSYGHRIWMDEHELLPGENWKVAIAREIRNSDIFLACLSKNAVKKRGFIQYELKTALEVLGTIPEGSIYLIPVLLEECKVPPSLEDLHYVRLDSSSAIDLIARAIDKAAGWESIE